MKDCALIADLVRAGLDAELVGRVVNEITASMSRTNVPDMSGTDYERLRKREWREANKIGHKSDGKQTMPVAIASRIVPDNVPDTPAASSLASFLSSSSVSPLATKQGSKREVVARRDRGTALPANWILPPIERAMAIELGMSKGEIDEFEVEFRDFWIAIPGARGRKCDWPATARNRLREVAKRRRKSHANGKSSATMDAFDDLIARAGGTVEGDPPMRDVTPRGGHHG